jgi:chemotaxis protein methyltransferase CheR
MIQDLPENTLQHLSSYFLSHTGLFFPQNKWNMLKKGLKHAAGEHGMDVLSFANHLLESPSPQQMINSLASYLTIGETYFLRDKNMFQILKDTIIRGMIDADHSTGKTISFLSAGCATGEEPYSIAILMHHMSPVLRDWKINIIGTDINANFLEKARQGFYTRWSLRETPEQIVKNCFVQTDANRFELLPHIKRMVKFFHLNLMEPDYTKSLNIRGEIDVVLCRNVLMYFDDTKRRQVIENLIKLISMDGWFITGPAESGFVQSAALTPVKFSNVILHQKKSPPPETPPGPFHSRKQDDRPKYAPFPRRPGTVINLPMLNKHRPAGFRQDLTDVEIYEEAKRDYENGNYKASVLKISKILNHQPKSDGMLIETELMTLLAKSHANLGELDHAAFWCKKAVESEKLNPEIRFLQASIFQDAGKIKEAIGSLKHAIYLDPDFIMAHFLMGMLLLGENNATESRKSLSNALSMLRNKDPEEVIPFSEGMTVARLIETITALLSR